MVDSEPEVFELELFVNDNVEVEYLVNKLGEDESDDVDESVEMLVVEDVVLVTEKNRLH